MATAGEGSAVPSRAVVDAVVGASRALVAIAARSIAATGEDVTLPQYRALVVLAGRGPQRVGDLAGVLGVNGSTATRMCDRLARKGLVRRQRPARDRRIVRVALSADGRALVDAVTRARRTELERVLARLPVEDQDRLVGALRTFADAAGEVPEHEWFLGLDDTP